MGRPKQVKPKAVKVHRCDPEPDPKLKNFLKEAEKERQFKRAYIKVDPKTLNLQQAKVYGIVEKHLKEGGQPLRCIVNGIAGSGKSTTIAALRGLFDLHKKKCMVLSFTGCSAHLVGGYTFHNGLRMPLYMHNFPPNTNVKEARRRLKSISYFMIDEVSLVGLHMFGFVSERLNAVYDVFSKGNMTLGGKSVILFGDYSQLRAIADYPLHDKRTDLVDYAKKGQEAYRTFDKAVLLTEPMRHKDSMGFFHMLNRLRQGILTPEDRKLIASRESKNLSKETLDFFYENALFVFADRKASSEFNEYRLKDMKREIVEILPIDSGRRKAVAKKLGKVLKGDASDFEEDDVLRICIGCKVICTSNLAASCGVFNGSLGVVTEILRPSPTSQPNCIFVKFDNYDPKARKFSLRNDVPVTRIKESVPDGLGGSYTRLVMPLRLGFSRTIHTSQGQTVDYLVMSLPREVARQSGYYKYSPSMVYTGISRVRSLDSIVFVGEFHDSLVLGRSEHFRQWNEEIQRLATLGV